MIAQQPRLGIRRKTLLRSRSRLPFPQSHRDPKGTSSSRIAPDPNFATHELGQTTIDGEPKPRASKLARGRAVTLFKSLENPFLLLRFHAAAGIDDVKTHKVALFILIKQTALEQYTALFGEFDGVTDVIDEGLREASGITVKGLRQVVAFKAKT